VTSVETVHRSVCSCNQSIGVASIIAILHMGSKHMSRMPPGHFGYTRWPLLSTFCSSGTWEGRGGHLAPDTWCLLSRDWGRRTVRLVRIALKIFIQNHVFFVELLEVECSSLRVNRNILTVVELTWSVISGITGGRSCIHKCCITPEWIRLWENSVWESTRSTFISVTAKLNCPGICNKNQLILPSLLITYVEAKHFCL
jgi:hypothetical protein